MEPSTSLVFIVLGFLVLSTGLFLPRLLRRRGAAAGRPGTFDPTPENVRGELEQLIVDLREAGREEIARLDTKLRILNQLLLECDQKKKELEALLGRAPAGPPAPRAREAPANPLHDQVYALFDQGRDLHSICAATGLEKGEVELILGLRSQKEQRTKNEEQRRGGL